MDKTLYMAIFMKQPPLLNSLTPFQDVVEFLKADFNA